MTTTNNTTTTRLPNPQTTNSQSLKRSQTPIAFIANELKSPPEGATDSIAIGTSEITKDSLEIAVDGDYNQ